MRDPDGFDEFYRATAFGMLSFARALAGSQIDAEDLVQEAYSRAWRRWSTVADHPSPAAWVRLVVVRLANDRWRRIRGLRSALVRSGPSGMAGSSGEDRVVLVDALRQLPANQRQALALHYLLDLSIADIAAETGAGVGTVKSRLSRGRARLAISLQDIAPGRTSDTPQEATDAR
jgi:RNA polymerase sigma-70 factor (ECF subfamily)